MIKFDNVKIAVVGLGYVGLPLAIEFSRKGFDVLGFDVNEKRIKQLKKGVDVTGEVDLCKNIFPKNLTLSFNPSALSNANVFIITVPTPITRYKTPDLTPLKSASASVGKALSPGNVVIYESTVYPGCTEDECVPILDSYSGLEFNTDFWVGYSPERINPGDKLNQLCDIVKVTAGSSPAAARFIDDLYSQIIIAGTHSASSIKVAEAAKVIENTQRDLNIALINELAMLFDRLQIPIHEVLAAAATKWNFLNFQPGLVGGHCIGVDPYYLTHKAMEVGFNPELVLAGRRTNDNMACYIAGRLVKEMIKRKINPSQSRVMVLGLTFKENCPDIRNTKIVDLITELKQFECQVDVHDPLVDSSTAHIDLGLEITDLNHPTTYDAVILAVAHNQYIELGIEVLSSLVNRDGFIFDLKGVLPPDYDCQRL